VRNCGDTMIKKGCIVVFGWRGCCKGRGWTRAISIMKKTPFVGFGKQTASTAQSAWIMFRTGVVEYARGLFSGTF